MRKKIGRYEVKKEITEGGQGKIYLAHDPLLKIDLAIKELLAPEGEHEREAFEREVLNMRTLLRSANIVRTYDFFTEGKNEYIGMEYVDGMSLFDLIVWQEGLPLSLSMFIFRQICQGLSDAHRKDIIHRDIKPQNILLSKDGDVMLTDFGIAGKVEDFSREASAYGSKHFMAPEQLDGSGIKGDKKTDVYSLGATLYTMLFGKPPFMGDAKKGGLEAEIIEHDYKKPADIDPDITKDVNDLIVSMLEKDPEERPAIEEVIAIVEDYEKSLAEGIRTVLRDALKASIASGKEKLDYRKLKLKDDWEPVDLCTPASLYTKNCLLQLSFDSESHHFSFFCSHLYALVFKCGDGGLRFPDTIVLSNSFQSTKSTVYQSEEQEFEPGEYLVRFDFGSKTYVRSFSLQRGQKQHIVVPELFLNTAHMAFKPNALDAESGEDITDRAICEIQNRNGSWIQRPLGQILHRTDLDFFRPFRVSCEGYESRELSVPPEIGLSPTRILLAVPLPQKHSAGSTDFDITGSVLQRYRGSAASVSIPDGVTEIAAGAFRDCSSVSAVTNLSGVTEIGEQAFMNCNIQTLSHPCLTIRDGCAVKDGKLLYRASQEADCTVPDDITEICGSAFAGCSSLRSVTIPKGVTAIGEKAFAGCRSLTAVEIPGSVTEIGNGVFSACHSLSAVRIPKSVVTIGENAFSACSSLTSVSIPGSVNAIGKGAFSDCTSLSTVTIPEGVTSIDGVAFARCTSLTAVEIPGSVTEIGYAAFADCTSLTSVHILEGVKEIDKDAFAGCTSLASIVIPDSVTVIDKHAFRDCPSLESVTIPARVTEIGSWAFSDCTSLTSVTILEGVTKIGGGAFSGCTSLTSVSIPGSVTAIGLDAFRNCNIRSLSHPCLTIREGLVIEDGQLLYRASQATAITIPNSVTAIGKRAFDGCTSLESVVIPVSVTEIGENAFWGCNSLTSIEIPSSVTAIGSDAFGFCTSLESVVIPGSVTAIGKGAFRNCTLLTSVHILEGVTEIVREAFSDCTSLTAVKIPDSVTAIGDHAFRDCNIRELLHPCLTIRDGLAIKGNRLLYRASQATAITIPEDVTEINGYAFTHCMSLESVIIPDSVTEIGRGTFWGCRSLASVTIPDSVTKIDWHAFALCTSLTEIRYAGTKVQWTAVKKDRDWHEEVPAKIVICSDGEVEL